MECCLNKYRDRIKKSPSWSHLKKNQLKKIYFDTHRLNDKCSEYKKQKREHNREPLAELSFNVTQNKIRVLLKLLRFFEFCSMSLL